MKRTTHTFATLPVSKECFEEIAARLLAAGYQHVFLRAVSGTMIDMQGLAIVAEQQESEQQPEEENLNSV